MLNYLSPTYSDWKAVVGTAYYVEYDNHYTGIKVIGAKEALYRIDISRDGQDPNMVDFETNVKGTATPVTSVDDAITLAL